MFGNQKMHREAREKWKEDDPHGFKLQEARRAKHLADKAAKRTAMSILVKDRDVCTALGSPVEPSIEKLSTKDTEQKMLTRLA